MLRRWISSLESWLGSSSEPDSAPRPDVEAAIDEARRRDQQLRNETARAIAEKIVLGSRIEELATAAGESEALARESLVRSDEARGRGDETGASRWAELALLHAGSLRALEDDLASLLIRYRATWNRAEETKSAIHDNAAGIEELSGGRPARSEIIDDLARALSTSIEDETPSPESLGSLIDRRASEASSRADLGEIEPGRHERTVPVDMTEAGLRLDALRADLDRGPSSPGLRPEQGGDE